MESVLNMTRGRIRDLDETLVNVKRVAHTLPGECTWWVGLKIEWEATRYTFTGAVSDKMVAALGRDMTKDEIIMMVDSIRGLFGGYTHFGAMCTLDGQEFSGYVKIDKEDK